MLAVQTLLKKLIDWFLTKAPQKLETLEEDRIEGQGVTLIRYRRRTARAYRTWRLVYKGLDYDIILGWDTLGYLPDVPVKKRNRLSTHALSIYRQGFHARFNPVRGCHEPDIALLVNEEVCLEAPYMIDILARWRKKTCRTPQPIATTEALIHCMIDEVAMYGLRHPPSEGEPSLIPWQEVVQQTVRLFLGQGQDVFPSRPTSDALGTAEVLVRWETRTGQD